MNSGYRRVSMIAVALIALWCASAKAQDDDVIKIDTSIVTLNVSVTGKGGHLPGFKASDFIVKDEGNPVKPEFFDAQGPISIVFVVDISASMKRNWGSLREGLKTFLMRAREGSDYSLVAFNGQAKLMVFSVNADGLWQSFNNLKPSGATALYDGLLLGLKTLEHVPQRHAALVLLSDGEDNSSRAGLAQVEEEVAAHRTTIYPVGITTEQWDPDWDYPGRRLLKKLAVATGGKALFPTATANKICDVLDSINKDLRNQYSFSYYAPEKTPGWRRVQIELVQPLPQVKLRYQERYLLR